MKIAPLRILDEKSGFLGLSLLDLCGLGYGLIILHSLLKPWGLELLSFALFGVSAFLLIGFRLKYRRKSIRDFFRYIFRSRVMGLTEK